MAKKRVKYSAISEIEMAFKSKGAAAVSSDTGPAIPVFDMTSYKNDTVFKGYRANPDVKIMNGIKALTIKGIFTQTKH
jgi:hypothetical protein